MHLHEIKFPVYAISNSVRRVWEEYNILYVETENGIYILDNKNLIGDTLGQRRLHIKGTEKYKFRKSYLSIEQFIHSKYSTFIDTYGKLFNWKKTTYVPLLYFKIKEVIHSKDGDCIIIPEKINYKLKVNCRVAFYNTYIGLLHTDMGYILYELTDKPKRNTRRKI
jgi:hypothetical protein